MSIRGTFFLLKTRPGPVAIAGGPSDAAGISRRRKIALLSVRDAFLFIA
jgi:hypothetical protein